MMVFEKARRLSKRDVLRVLKSSKVRNQEIFVVRYQKGSGPRSRFAFVIGKKVARKAAERNRIRRRLSTIVREHCDTPKMPFDFVFLVLPAIAKCGGGKIRSEVETFFNSLTKAK